jgi:hypothetical protein
MIVFNGIKKDNNLAFLLLSNELNQTVEVPIDVVVADRISKYLSKITTSPVEMAERGNDDEAE